MLQTLVQKKTKKETEVKLKVTLPHYHSICNKQKQRIMTHKHDHTYIRSGQATHTTRWLGPDKQTKHLQTSTRTHDHKHENLTALQGAIFMSEHTQTQTRDSNATYQREIRT